MESLLDGLINFFESRVGGESVVATEELSFSEGITMVDILGKNGSVTWLPLEDDQRNKIVLEKEVWGNNEEAINEHLTKLTLEDQSNASQIRLRVIEPPKPAGVRRSQIRVLVYLSPKNITEFKVETANGGIKIVTEFNCRMDLRTKNGSINLAGGTGAIYLKTSNGEINLSELKLSESSEVQTANGRIVGSLGLAQTGKYSFVTSNGGIDLQLLDNINGNYLLTTSNGSLDLQLGSECYSGRKKLVVSKGEGPEIIAKTSNGSIRIKS